MIKRTLTTAALLAAVGLSSYAYGQATTTPVAPAVPTVAAQPDTTGCTTEGGVLVAPLTSGWHCSLSTAAPVPGPQPAPVAAVCSAPQASAQSVAEAPAAAPVSTGTGVNLNTASKAELVALPGIGAKTADRIIAARPLASVDAISKLPGVTSANYALFAGKVTV